MTALETNDDIDARLIAFERAARRDVVPDIDSFLPAVGDASRSEAIRELVRVDFEMRWARGERPDLDRYLQRYPELRGGSSLADVAYEHYRQSIMNGDRASREDYRARFGLNVSHWPSVAAGTKQGVDATRPDGSEACESFEATRAVDVRPTTDVSGEAVSARTRQMMSDTAEIPGVGATVAGFRLVRELGKGAFGRVFLAEQVEMAGRRVAVKISTRLKSEMRTLARLQHTNIVPVYSAHPGPRFNALCMPYFGAATLSDVLETIAAGPPPVDGHILAEVVGRKRGKAVTFSASANYVNEVLNIGQRLADALAHANERGIIHRDVKPANILLADDGQPMLLDFNLADDANEVAAERAHVGGTLPYMAPEVLRAFETRSTRRADGRADVYALGVVLYQLLCRRFPYPTHSGPTRSVVAKMVSERTGPPPALRPYHPGVSPAVESIVRKCLEPDPARRYASAADLRDDLARQRANLPLKFAKEPSATERAKKWARRHPRLTSPAALTSYAAAVALLVSAAAVRSSLDARARQQDADRLAAVERLQEFRTAADDVRQAAGSPSGAADVFRKGMGALARFDATEADWEDRPAVRLLSPGDRERLRADVGELAFLTARAAALAKADPALAGQLNDIVRGSPDSTIRDAAETQRTVLAGGRPVAVAAADGSRGSYLLACDLAALGEHRDALPLASAYVERNADDFGGWYVKARCHDALDQYEEALAAYGTSAALRPRSAQVYFARGSLAYRHGKDLAQALADLTRALAIDPELVDAKFNRALVLHALGRNDDALVDLDAVVARGLCPTRVWFIRAIVRDAKGDRDGAAADRTEGLKREPADPSSWVARGLARADADPAGALADFEAAERLDPLYPDAMSNQGWVLAEKLNKPAEAVTVLDRLLSRFPDHRNARGGRAVLLARLGRGDEAIAAARSLLATAADGQSCYQAGCVFAILAVKDSTRKAEAVRLVSKALLRGFGHEYVVTDPDLDGLRQDVQLKRIVDGVKAIQESSKD